MDSYALLSGGYDSVVATHKTMSEGLADRVLHLDTTTGIPANQDYVEKLCKSFGWDLRIERAPMTLLEFATKYGFPGPAAHNWAYRYFKERSLRAVARDTDGKPHFYTGVRKSESVRRMRTVEPGEREADQWVWHSPIAGFSDHDIREYLDAHSLPNNPVVDNIHRSGECFCGAFADRDTELIDLQANYPDHYDYIQGIEQEILSRSDLDIPADRSVWANGSLSSNEARAVRAESDPSQAVLCEGCNERYEAAKNPEIIDK